METRIHTDSDLLNSLYPAVRGFLEQDQVDYVIDGVTVHGYRSPDCPALWVRDHSDMLRGARYFDSDMTSGTTHFADTQLGNGSLFDFVSCNMDRENWTKYVRVPVEADVEYRFVKAVYLGWQATGDDDWLRRMVPHAERALDYIRTHPWRWSAEHGLVKRTLTMDTWDFDYVSADQPWLNFQITDDSHWGIFHGDNSGYCEAFRLLGMLCSHLGEDERASTWDGRADDLRRRANALCWNGSFYTHRVPLDDFCVDGVEEIRQLTLSNPMAINRGLADHEQAVALLQEYIRRGNESDAFAPWFSIDPPYPDGCFGDPKLVGGAYINGGIFPLVGGELARAAFEHGYEGYGVEILTQYADLIRDTGETYLWYFPDGSPSSAEASTSPEATATDGWGSSAMLYALVEGLAGVSDTGCLFRRVRLAPRWLAAGVQRAEVCVAYGASDAGVSYTYTTSGDTIQLDVEGRAQVDLHVLLPEGRSATGVQADGESIAYESVMVESSPYVDAGFAVDGATEIRITSAVVR